MTKIKVDFRSRGAAIKPLHGVNNSPVVYNGTIQTFVDAGIPFVRTHDSGGAYGNSVLVDIPNIFRDFEADVEDPASYDFAFTDAYLATLVNSGCRIFYRLGVTIENNYRIKAYRIHPPSDFAKWARICEHIVRHYNEGWANGFHYGIEYWEIWNEPENPPMWQGTRDEYFALYRIAANHLKQCFPQIKVGGYGGCGFYAVTGDNTTEFYKSFVTWFDEFLKFVTNPRTAAPLDFYSWHLYTTDPGKILRHADYVDAKLKAAGLSQVENIFNEWNYVNWNAKSPFDDMKGMLGACFTASAFCLMQNSPIDMAMYYDALPSRSYGGMFEFPSGRPSKAYYAFQAFNELYRLGAQAREQGARNARFAYLAAANGTEAALLLVNNGPRGRQVELDLVGLPGKMQGYPVDDTHNLARVNMQVGSRRKSITLPPWTILLLATGFQPAGAVNK